MISFDKLENKEELELLLTESELETLQMQYIVSQHKGMGEDPLLKTCVKLLYRNQLLEKENKILLNQKNKIIDYINNKSNYDKTYHYKEILKILDKENK